MWRQSICLSPSAGVRTIPIRSGRKTEPVWDGKYDEYGARRPVDIAGSAMPMQKIETEATPRSKVLARI